MGGCLSRKDPPTHTTTSKKTKKKKKNRHPGVDPPPLPASPSEEEAVVKEVLTETPTSAVVAAVSNNSRRRVEDAKLVKPGRPHKVDVAASSTPPPTSVNGCCRYGVDGGSEVEGSEMWSASESFSVSTTMTSEKREDLGEEETSSVLRKGAAAPSAKRRVPERSPNAWKSKSYQQRTQASSSPGEPPCRRCQREPKRGTSSGSARSSPSPAKRPLSDGRSTFPLPGRDAARQRTATGRKDHHGRERSGTGGRSGSPAAKWGAAGGGGGRIAGGVNNNNSRPSSPMRRMAGPGRASPDRTPRRDEEEEREKQEAEGAMLPPAPAPASEEMLENPLVSLECFIFL